MTTPHRTLREAAQMALDALLTGYHQGTQDAIAALREALAAPEPKPVALESVHLTRDTKGMCVVRVNGRVAIRDNGDIIDHMATLEWFAAPPAAPDHLRDTTEKVAPAQPAVPLTDGRITAIANELAYAGGLCNVYEFARAIEQAHGIGITGASK